ncbi:unnamed protein product [Porites evermanni]|uniref:Uncharacterized protein n=1 Tax=Porites evermanni TaxID=104178 RepID=A0ABN8LPC8_9CNID|nr:unnamed protein product [Porites evermanni]
MGLKLRDHLGISFSEKKDEQKIALLYLQVLAFVYACKVALRNSEELVKTCPCVPHQQTEPKYCIQCEDSNPGHLTLFCCPFTAEGWDIMMALMNLMPIMKVLLGPYTYWLSCAPLTNMSLDV